MQSYDQLYGQLQKHSRLRWIISASSAFFILIFFFLLVLKSKQNALPDLPYIMELDYVVVEEEKKDPPKPPEPVKRTTVQAQPEEKTEPTPPQEIIPQDVPLESSDESIDQAQVYVPPIPAPVKKIVSDQPVSIEAVSELDNVDFDPIFNPKPVYPKMALDANIEGYVDAELVVTEDGRVETFSFTRVAGHPSFGTETAKVLSRWRFPPPRIKGEKAKIRYIYRINFNLD